MPLRAVVPSFPIMTGNHKDKSISRRRAIAVTGGTVAAGGLVAAGFQSAFADTMDTTTDADVTASASSTGSECMTLMTSVTEGPYYLDGALVRKDITEGKSGVPLTLQLTVVDAIDGCTPVSGAAVEIWHCDATGDYSAFRDNGGGKDAAAGTTFLRGTQSATREGIVEFATVYPGWYRGRAVHIHLRVHHDDATVLTSQLFFPDDYTDAVYASAPYAPFGTPDTRNADDSIAGDPTTEGTLVAVRDADTGRGAGTLALLNLGISA